MSGIFGLESRVQRRPLSVAEINALIDADTDPLAAADAALDTRVDALEQSVALSVRRSASQSVADATDSIVAFDDVTEDTHTAWNVGTRTYTIPVAGLYAATYNIRWAPSVAGTYRQALFRIDGTDPYGVDLRPPMAGGLRTYLNASLGPVRLAVGQTVRVEVKQDSGGALNVEAGTGGLSSLQLTWVGP